MKCIGKLTSNGFLSSCQSHNYILIVFDSQSMREFATENKFSPERVRFTYVLMERQSDFVNSLVDATPDAKGKVQALSEGKKHFSNFCNLCNVP